MQKITSIYILVHTVHKSTHFSRHDTVAGLMNDGSVSIATNVKWILSCKYIKCCYQQTYKTVLNFKTNPSFLDERVSEIVLRTTSCFNSIGKITIMHT